VTSSWSFSLQSTKRLFMKICHAAHNTLQYSSASQGTVHHSHYTPIIVSTSADMHR